jgi:hypothetical protein
MRVGGWGNIIVNVVTFTLIFPHPPPVTFTLIYPHPSPSYGGWGYIRVNVITSTLIFPHPPYEGGGIGKY